ncbi:methyltransferase domain-containing protein [Botrimarina hoheduenensis]|uniref:Methyltransferase domain-containing protein n=1 Tax=Botrimarina hoheduenensis TaxID=2528000 RepID=A0A5C5VZF0_9BACT|nr:methyltransferase domain-containing protein [Botrimarina hoheduenensis]TWT43141.1 hypothetical protein Pla111_20910 [Botrimarina hoheduenensis]
MRLARRNLQPELMDAPDLDPRHHAQALRGLARLNVASGAAASVWRAVRQVTTTRGSRPLRLLDIASGGGDVALGVWRRAQAAGVPVEIEGIDISPTAVSAATARVPSGASVRFRQADVLNDPLPEGFDVVMSSLFLHHLEDTDTEGLLKRMAAAADRGIVVSDLRRSRLGYWLAQLACRTLTRSPIVQYDGPQSVAAAYTLDEMRQRVAAAELKRARVARDWPQRLLVTWRRDDA